MILWLIIAAFIVLGAIGLTLAFTAGETSNFFGWTPNPIGCLMFVAAVIGAGGVGLFYLGMRVAQ